MNYAFSFPSRLPPFSGNDLVALPGQKWQAVSHFLPVKVEIPEMHSNTKSRSSSIARTKITKE
jgi:hypothetical protein